MARKRMISPDFFVSRTMNALPIQTMVTFAGVWCWADDYGRGEDDEALVRAAVWPRRKAMTDKRVREDISLLVDAKVLCQYDVAGVQLLHVTNWQEHQKISHPTPSKLPPCRIHDSIEWDEFERGDDPALAKFRSDSGGIRE